MISLPPLAPRLRTRARRAAEAFARRIDNMSVAELRPWLYTSDPARVALDIRMTFSDRGSFASVRILSADPRREDIRDLPYCWPLHGSRDHELSVAESAVLKAWGRAVVERRYGARPLYLATDAELAGLTEVEFYLSRPVAQEIDPRPLLEGYLTDEYANREIDVRLLESNHDRVQRLGATTSATREGVLA